MGILLEHKNASQNVFYKVAYSLLAHNHNPLRFGGVTSTEEMYGIMTKISSVSSQNQLLMLKNAPEFTKIMIREICTSL